MSARRARVASPAEQLARCNDDAERAELAAYLHVVKDVPFGELASALSVESPAARRIVERGSGNASVTATETCRGWALVAPRPGRTGAEHSAANGHLVLCRHCRNRLHAHELLEQRVAKVGSATVGVSVATAVVRAFTGNAAGGVAGALPTLALGTAAALAAGAGALTATLHLGHDSPRHSPIGQVVGTERKASQGTSNGAPTSSSGSTAGGATSAPGGSGSSGSGSPAPSPSSILPLPSARNLLPLQIPTAPSVSAPAVPVPGVSVPGLPVPTVSAPAVKLPSPTLSPTPLP